MENKNISPEEFLNALEKGFNKEDIKENALKSAKTIYDEAPQKFKDNLTKEINEWMNNMNGHPVDNALYMVNEIIQHYKAMRHENGYTEEGERNALSAITVLLQAENLLLERKNNQKA